MPMDDPPRDATYGDELAVRYITQAADVLKAAIVRNVIDPDSRKAAIGFVEQAQTTSFSAIMA